MLKYQLTNELQVGVEYSPLSGVLMPLANWTVMHQTRRRPAVLLGTAMDRIGTDGRAYYLTFAKDLQPLTGLAISPYVGLLWSEEDQRFRVPAGATIRFARGWSFLPTYDGHAFHPMLSYQWDRFTVTGILVRGRDPGIAFAVGF